MPDFGTALKSRLAADAGVIAAGGNEIHWVKVPQGKTLPYVRLQTISDPRPEHLKGYDGARVSRIQADCFAASWGQARKIAEAIITAATSPMTVEGIQFGHTKAEGPNDLGEDVGTAFVHRASIDLLVEHRLA